MISGLVIVCMLHFNVAWLGIDIQREDVVVDSQAQCNKIAIERGRHFSGIGTVMSYDLARDSDKKQFTVRCGVEGRDCPDLRSAR